MEKIYLFDLFDTLAVRRAGPADCIHFQTGIRVQKELQVDIEPEVFAHARIEIEKSLKRNKNRTPLISEIYENLIAEIDISENTAKEILKTEQHVELENILPVDVNINILNKIRDNGGIIHYISDTCLESNFIKKILDTLDIHREGEKIYTPHDFPDGAIENLIPLVKEDLRLEDSQICYYGNNADLFKRDANSNTPGNHRVRTVNFNRYEKYLLNVPITYNLSAKTALKYSNIAGCCRFARMRQKNENRVIYDVAVSVAAPVLISFVSNILEKAAGKTIYFLARDGYIMYLVAKRINKLKKYDVDLKYLQLSREVMVLANLDEMDYEDYVDYLKKIFAFEKMEYLLSLFSLEREDIKSCHPDSIPPDKKISSFDGELLDRFFNDPDVKAAIKLESEERKRRLVAYLEQEKVLSDQPITIVDAGWNLTTQNILARFLKSRGKKPPEGFYFGVNEKANVSVNNGKKHGYFWDLRKGYSSLREGKMEIILEIFCTAPHGRTLDYTMTETAVIPVLDNHEAEYLRKWGVNDLIYGIESAVETILIDNAEFSPKRLDSEILAGLINLFWKKPTSEEVTVWGDYPFVITRDGERVFQLHQRNAFLMVLKKIITKGKLPNESHDFWPHANLYSSDSRENFILQYSFKLKKSSIANRKIL